MLSITFSVKINTVCTMCSKHIRLTLINSCHTCLHNCSLLIFKVLIVQFCFFFFFLDKTAKTRDIEDGYTQPVNSVSAAILAKVLEKRVQERLTHRHCLTCSCSTKSIDSNTDQLECLSTQADPCDKRIRSLNKCSKRSTATKSSESLLSESDLALSFDNSVSITDSSDYGVKLSARSRLCSVRLQEGSNNILLDNAATPYSGPVLYKSRSSSGEYDEPLVHSQKLTERNILTNEHTRILISDEEII